MANIGGLIENYKTQFSSTSQKVQDFVANLPNKLNEWKDSAMNLQGTVTNYAKELLDKLQNQILDFQPVGTNQAFHASMMDNYIGAGLCLFVGALGYLVGSTFTPWLVEMMFSLGYCWWLAILLIPWSVSYIIARTEMSRDDRFMILLLASFSAGVFHGYLLTAKWLGFKPPATWLITTLIGVLSGFVGPAMGGQPRTVFLGALIGPAVAVCFFGGVVTGGTGGTFFLYMLVMGGVAFADYQLKVGRMYDGTVGMATSQWYTIITFQITTYLLTSMFGSSEPPQDNNE